MSFHFGTASLRKLQGVHPDLRRIVTAALEASPVDFSVVEGLRTLARQKQLVAAGASHTLDSRHLTGHAVDIAPWLDGELRWDWPLFPPLAATMKRVAATLALPIEWGGDWKMRDGPHFQLPWAAYPKA